MGLGKLARQTFYSNPYNGNLRLAAVGLRRSLARDSQTRRVGEPGFIYRRFDHGVILGLSGNPGEKQSRCLGSKNTNYLSFVFTHRPYKAPLKNDVCWMNAPHTSIFRVILCNFFYFPLYYNLEMSSTDERSLARRVLQGDRKGT